MNVSELTQFDQPKQPTQPKPAPPPEYKSFYAQEGNPTVQKNPEPTPTPKPSYQAPAQPSQPTPTPQNPQQNFGGSSGVQNKISDIQNKFGLNATAQEGADLANQVGGPDEMSDFEKYQNASPEQKKMMEEQNPLLGTEEYKMQQFLNKPVFDVLEKQKMMEGQKYVDMVKMLDQQAGEDNLMIQDQLSSLELSMNDNLSLLNKQKEIQSNVLAEEKKSRKANLAEAKADQEQEYDEQIRTRQADVLKREEQERTALGMMGGFGSQARIGDIYDYVNDGNKLVQQLQIAKGKLSKDFAFKADEIEKDYSKGMQEVLFSHDQNVISLKKEMRGSILEIKQNALLTKRQRDEKYLSLKNNFFDRLSEFETTTATMMADMNKTTYKSIIDAQAAELEAKQKEEEAKWTKATKVIDMYGGVNGAVLAEKMLGLEEGTLPRVQTTEEVKQQLDYLKYESDNYFKQAGLDLNYQKLAVDQDQFAASLGLDYDRLAQNQGQFDAKQQADLAKMGKTANPLTWGEDEEGTSTSAPGGIITQKIVDVNPKKVSGSLKANCVFFARSLVPDFPTVGLSNTSKKVNEDGKRARINSKTPVAGSVFIAPSYGFYGHVGYVEKVHDDGTITIWHANDPTPGVRHERINPAKKKIEGYFVGKGAVRTPLKQIPKETSEILHNKNNTKSSKGQVSLPNPANLNTLAQKLKKGDLSALPQWQQAVQDFQKQGGDYNQQMIDLVNSQKYSADGVQERYNQITGKALLPGSEAFKQVSYFMKNKDSKGLENYFNSIQKKKEDDDIYSMIDAAFTK